VVPVHADDDAMLRLLLRERFPRWKAVLNESAAAQLVAESAEKRRLELIDALGPDDPIDQLSVARNKRAVAERVLILNAALDALPVDHADRIAE
jgi:hypothetical protein